MYKKILQAKIEFNKAQKELDIVVAEALVFIKDETKPVASRWQVYEEIAAHLDVASGCVAINGVHEYHHNLDSLDRREVVYFIDMVKEIEQNVTGDDENLDCIKAQILALGKSGFIYDW